MRVEKVAKCLYAQRARGKISWEAGQFSYNIFVCVFMYKKDSFPLNSNISFQTTFPLEKSIPDSHFSHYVCLVIVGI